MQDFSITRCTKKCRLADRPLVPGESYYSVVVLRGSQTSRFDIASENWKGPPEKAIAWWQSQMPLKKTLIERPTSNAELLGRFVETLDNDAQSPLAYLLGMLLVRRKVLQFSDPKPLSTDRIQNPVSSVTLKSCQTDDEYDVVEPDLNASDLRLQVYQAALSEMLVTNTLADCCSEENEATDATNEAAA